MLDFLGFLKDQCVGCIGLYGIVMLSQPYNRLLTMNFPQLRIIPSYLLWEWIVFH